MNIIALRLILTHPRHPATLHNDARHDVTSMDERYPEHQGSGHDLNPIFDPRPGPGATATRQERHDR